MISCPYDINTDTITSSYFQLQISPACAWLRYRIHIPTWLLVLTSSSAPCALAGWPLVALLTPCTQKSELACVFSLPQMLPSGFFKVLCQLFDTDTRAISATTAGREDTAEWFPGLVSLLAVGRE